MGLVNLNSPTSFYSFSDNPFSITPNAYPLLRVSGSKGGWSGFDFSAFNKQLLLNNQFQGVFEYGGAGWLWRFNNGLLDIGSVPWANISDSPLAAALALPGGGLYTSASLSGINGGYAGINFPSVNTNLMINNAVQGVYRYNSTTGVNEWLWYFNAGVLTVGSIPWARLTGIPNASASQAGLVSNESSGVWTPRLRGSTTVGAVTYGANYGSYVRIGDLVTAKFTIFNAANFTGIGTTENAIIDQLPFPCSTGNGKNGALQLSIYSGITFVNHTQLLGRLSGGTSQIQLMKCGPGFPNANLQIQNITSGSNILEGSISYQVD